MTGLQEPKFGHARLQEPFPASQIQKLNQAGGLDYVSHGNVTKRLLEVDPEWNWEPVAFDEHGLPLFDEHGGLWIKLTVLGITRYGYGEPQGGNDWDKTKGAVSNAIRVAAMRFGVALDLWAKDIPAEAPSARSKPMPRVQGKIRSFTEDQATDKQIELINKMTGGDMSIVTEWKLKHNIDRPLAKSEASQLIDELKSKPTEEPAEPQLDSWGLPIE